MPQSRQTRWFAALAALVVFVLLAWLLGATLSLTDGERVVVRVGLITLGLIAAVALLWFLRPTDQPVVAAGGEQKDDALLAVESARGRLGRGAFDASPLVLVLGTEGSAKTSIVTRAGLDPDLLAGDATGGSSDRPAATAGVNLWKVKGAVLAEAGGKLLGDGARWQRLVRALRAPRLAAAVGRGEPAPRAAVVCVGCDLFYTGAGEQLDAAAALLRARLGELSRDWGLALPVYVLFTKADRIPHFEAWSATLARDEARAPLGAALPFDPQAAAGGYAERLAPRVDAAFGRLAESLAGWRLALLGRESVAERRLGAYELPRELGKLAPAATRFLTELCRPTQLGTSPMLRGFYFVGVRPVVVTDAATAAAPAAAQPSAPAARASRATSMFTPPVIPGATPTAGAAQAPGYAPPTSRRVPQWAFLERLFPEVILADSGAAAAARGGARVSGLRRALLGAGIAAALLAAVGVAVSWGRNRALATRTETAARAVAALPVVSAPTGTIVFPSAEALRTLDGLRGVLDTLGRYDADGPPLSMRWGLWRGRALRDAGERVWLDGYRRQLHAVAWGTLVDSLRALPDAPRPTDDYGRSYADLKAYLITTAEPARSTPDFLAPVLLREWQRGQPLDADVTALARRQFEYYAAMLPRQNPFPQPADAGLVQRSRDFLGRFAGAERIYQFMLAEASKAAPPAKVTDLAPAAAGVVSAPEVPGAFTAAGWKFMDAAFKDSDRFFQGERWVVGDAGAAQAQDRDRVIAELRARYRADYVAQWRQYVRGLAVARASGVKDAAAKLGAVGGAQSPLLAALALAARNTNIDSAMRAAFQPVQAVTPGEVVDKFVSPDNETYVNALVSLQGTLEQVGNMPPPSDTASAQALSQAATQAQMTQVAPAKAAARQLAGKFAVDTAAAPIGPAVAAFLLAPIEGAELALRTPAAVRPPTVRVATKGGGAPPPAGAAANVGMKPAELAATLNERGRALCAMMTPMLAKFPFSPDAQAEATVAEVSAALAPGTGALWALYQERLDGLLEKQGNQWVEKAGAPVGLSGAFVEFFNRAARSSAALFPAGATEPRVALSARGVATDRIPEVVLEQGPQVARFGKSAPAAQLTWPAAGAREAKLAAVTNSRLTRDRERTVARGTGEWALFRLVAQAAKWEGGGGSYRAEWNSGSGPVVVEFAFPSGAPVLQRGWLGGMACSPQITK